MTTEELLQAGIKAAKAGDAVKASQLLGQIVQTNPYSELAWLWLGLCRQVPQQREYCFRQVLTINPQNAEARHQLELLRRSTINVQEKVSSTPTNEIPRTSIPRSVESPQDPDRPDRRKKPFAPIRERKMPMDSSGLS